MCHWKPELYYILQRCTICSYLWSCLFFLLHCSFIPTHYQKATPVHPFFLLIYLCIILYIINIFVKSLLPFFNKALFSCQPAYCTLLSLYCIITLFCVKTLSLILRAALPWRSVHTLISSPLISCVIPFSVSIICLVIFSSRAKAGTFYFRLRVCVRSFVPRVMFAKSG
jgi:hypothetical protein